jgi:hypothetical protein
VQFAVVCRVPQGWNIFNRAEAILHGVLAKRRPTDFDTLYQ